MFGNIKRSRQARNFATNVPKILDLKSSSEQKIDAGCPWFDSLSNLTPLHTFVSKNIDLYFWHLSREFYRRVKVICFFHKALYFV